MRHLKQWVTERAESERLVEVRGRVELLSGDGREGSLTMKQLAFALAWHAEQQGERRAALEAARTARLTDAGPRRSLRERAARPSGGRSSEWRARCNGSRRGESGR